MNDDEKIKALRELDEAATHATKVANGLVRGSERAAFKKLAVAYDKIALAWIGRRLTDTEMTS